MAAVLFIVFSTLCFASGFFGEAAFGGLEIYGPYSLPKRPVDHALAAAFGACWLASIVACLFTFRGMRIEFPQWPNVPPSVQIVQLLGYAMVLLLLKPFDQSLQQRNMIFAVCVYEMFVMAPIFTFILANSRGYIIPATLFIMFPWHNHPFVNSDPAVCGTFSSWFCNFWVHPLVVMFLANSTPYLRDQRLALCILGLEDYVCFLGGATYLHFIQGADIVPFEVFVALALSVVCIIYALQLASRYERILPTTLRNVKFNSLGGLRNMLRAGQRIARCQEMPEDSFGDVSKAAVLIVTSHRWLDRFSCDLPTDGCPNGLRLHSMVSKLSSFFPESFADACGAGCWWFLTRLWYGQLYGNNDVLIFFDFTALPQIGKDATGELIQRTEQETQLFFEALPSMGALYSMYPVLVLEEIVGDAHPYWVSGWCFSEFSTSVLTRKLDEYSSQAVANYKAWLAQEQSSTAGIDFLTNPSFTLDAVAAPKIVEFFEAQLAEKRFFNEQDREVVRGIVRGYVIFRQLSDAVMQGAVLDTKSLVAEIKAQKLEAQLNLPVDASLDTLLHKAVGQGHLEITQLLLNAGTDPAMKNLRGDRPDQWLMLSRCSSAAAVCRAACSATPKGYASLPR